MSDSPYAHDSPHGESSPGELRASWHPRRLHDFLYVYAVLSRRAGGLSIGVNLSLDKHCTFHCVYCEVNRKIESRIKDIDAAAIRRELDALLAALKSGEAYRYPPFHALAPDMRRPKDVAFSGDGEPTALKNFGECVREAGEALKQAGFGDVPIVLITNATYFHKPWMADGLKALDEYPSEIWAKLDAGTQEYLRRINGTDFPMEKLLDNINTAGKERAIAIQSMFLKIRGELPPAEKIGAYIGRLKDLLRRGTMLRRVLAYTVARPPAESYVSPLAPSELDAIAEKIREETGLKVETFY